MIVYKDLIPILNYITSFMENKEIKTYRLITKKILDNNNAEDANIIFFLIFFLITIVLKD